MRFEAKSLFLSTSLLVVIFVLNIPADARTTTGWNSFRVWSPIGADNCVGESFGAAINLCSSDINLTFEMLVDTPGWKTVTVTNSPGGYGTLTCAAVSFSGVNDGIVSTYAQTFNVVGQQTLTFRLSVSAGWGFSLYCWNISPGRGIAKITWGPA
jgi:hypothetical protein